MSKLVQPGGFLRNVLKADALLSAATAVAMTLGAGVLAPATGLPTNVLLLVGVALIPWVADCTLVAFGVGGFDLTQLGVAFAAVNALGTLLLADLEFIGLRRSAPAMA